MIGIISSLFGKSKHDFKALIEEGAVIVDVRTSGEFKGGHITKSVNIPLNILSQGIKKMDKEKTIITCCASGVRSANAKSILIASGFKNVVNGGGWRSLESKLR